MRQKAYLPYILWLGLGISCVPISLSGQEPELVVSLLEMTEEESLEDTDWIENLWDLTENPLDLNRASLNDLLRIPFLDAHLAHQIIAYRKNRPFTRREDLYQIEGMSEELYTAVCPLIAVKSTGVPYQILYRFRVKYEFPLRLGYSNGRYHNPFYLQHRLLFQTPHHISGGFLWEKDPGEADYFDHGTYHLHYQSPGKKLAITLGDYYQKIATGLIMWSSYGLPLSSSRLPVLSSRAVPTQLNRSAGESGFLRGISIQSLLHRHLDVNVFYSANCWDGSYSIPGGAIGSIDQSGLHRTARETANRDLLQEKVMGIVLTGKIDPIVVQLAGAQNRYEPGIYSYGSNHNYISLSYHYSGNGIAPAGEWALFQGKYPAIQQHIFCSAGPVRFEWIGYYYHRHYFALHGRAFGSFSGEPGNQTGMAIVVNYQLTSHLKAGGYVKQSRENYRITGNPYPSRDYQMELLARLPHQRIRIRIRQKYRPNSDMHAPDPDKTVSAFHLNYQIDVSRNVHLGNTVEIRRATSLPGNVGPAGLSLFHQLSWKGRHGRIWGRWTIFDVADYDLRIYEVEPDLPGSFRSVLLNERGYKMFILITWNFSQSIRMDFKYGQRYYPDQQEVGSGLDLISSNRVHDFRISFIWKR